jgi:hypothetical protein
MQCTVAQVEQITFLLPCWSLDFASSPRALSISSIGSPIASIAGLIEAYPWLIGDYRSPSKLADYLRSYVPASSHPHSAFKYMQLSSTLLKTN